MNAMQTTGGLDEADPHIEEEFERFWDDLAQDVETERAVSVDDSLPSTETGDGLKPVAFEEQVAEVRAVVNGKASHREILRKILAYCIELRELGDIERTVQAYPEFAYAAQNPYRLIAYLVDGGGLEQVDLDEYGDIVTDERKQGLSEDEVDDLVLTYGFATTAAGRVVADEMAPRKRIDKLLSHMPERFDAYVDLLDFCREPKSMTAIDNLFGGRDLSHLKSLNTGSTVAIKPSAFVDKLERAGGIVWKDGWVLTDEGKTFLEAVLEGRG